jgi:hypothetical protein
MGAGAPRSVDEAARGAAKEEAVARRLSWGMTIAGTVALLAVSTAALGAEATTATTTEDFSERATTLKRAGGNVVQGPMDFILTPQTVVRSVRYTAETREYEWWQTAAYAPLAATWIGGLNLVSSGYRIFAGLLEVPVGVMLLGTKSFTNWEPEPFFEPGNNPAIFDEGDWKFGVQYIGEGPQKQE